MISLLCSNKDHKLKLRRYAEDETSSSSHCDSSTKLSAQATSKVTHWFSAFAMIQQFQEARQYLTSLDIVKIVNVSLSTRDDRKNNKLCKNHHQL